MFLCTVLNIEYHTLLPSLLFDLVSCTLGPIFASLTSLRRTKRTRCVRGSVENQIIQICHLDRHITGKIKLAHPFISTTLVGIVCACAWFQLLEFELSDVVSASESSSSPELAAHFSGNCGSALRYSSSWLDIFSGLSIRQCVWLGAPTRSCCYCPTFSYAAGTLRWPSGKHLVRLVKEQFRL